MSHVDSLRVEMSIATRMVEGDECAGMTMRWCDDARWGPQIISSGKTARDEGKVAHDEGLVVWGYGKTSGRAWKPADAVFPFSE